LRAGASLKGEGTPLRDMGGGSANRDDGEALAFQRALGVPLAIRV